MHFLLLIASFHYLLLSWTRVSKAPRDASSVTWAEKGAPQHGSTTPAAVTNGACADDEGGAGSVSAQAEQGVPPKLFAVPGRDKAPEGKVGGAHRTGVTPQPPHICRAMHLTLPSLVYRDTTQCLRSDRAPTQPPEVCPPAIEHVNPARQQRSRHHGAREGQLSHSLVSPASFSGKQLLPPRLVPLLLPLLSPLPGSHGRQRIRCRSWGRSTSTSGCSRARPTRRSRTTAPPCRPSASTHRPTLISPTTPTSSVRLPAACTPLAACIGVVSRLPASAERSLPTCCLSSLCILCATHGRHWL